MIRSGGDEAAAPKYAHVERERRWLVAAPPALDGVASVLIEDRYIRNTRLRLRRMTGDAQDDGGVVARKLTKKYDSADPAARPIVTAYLDAAEYAAFASLPAATVLKRRYTVDGWSVDVFKWDLAGLVLVEREAADAGALAALAPPAWAGREVTGDPRYRGGALASGGIPEE